MRKLSTLLFLAFLSLTTWAYDFQVDQLCYNILSETEVEVTRQQSVSSSNPAYSSISAALTIPGTVIYNGAAYTVTSIGTGAFKNCSSLTSVTISSTVTSIGAGAFSGCSSLSGALTIPTSVTSIGSTAFLGCSSLSGALTIPNSVISIGYSAFADCNSVTSITIPNSVTSIGRGAFANCNSVTSITIGNSLTNIGDNVFSGMRDLSVYKNYSLLVMDYSLVKISTSLDTLICPVAELNQITEEELFTCPKQLKSITIHSGQLDANGFAYVTRQKKTLGILDMENTTNTELADMALYDCYKLHTIKLPSTLEYIGYRAIADCVELQEITIPTSLTETGDRAFENCRSLSAVHFGEVTPNLSNLQRIGNWVFYNCHKLQDFSIPNGVTEIGDAAFYNCHLLQSLNIPEGVVKIGDAAFYGCTYLQELYLPSSLISIGDNSFAQCSKLQRITVDATTPPAIESRTYYEVERTIPVYIPQGTLSAYQADMYWREFNLVGGGMDTALPQTQDDPIGCYTANGMLHNPNGISLCIYTMQGTLVYTGNAAEIQMPSQGIYILKTPTATSKVIL